MATYKFELVATYSDVIEIEAESEERAYDLAIDTAPNWVSFGDKMAYTEDVKAYNLEGVETGD